jgi:hypothetical protein
MSGAKSFCWPSSPSRYTTKAPALAGLGPFRITATEAGTTEVSDGSAKSTGYPNPFTMKLGGVDFDDKLSSSRRNVVNSLFDHVITFRHAELRAAPRRRRACRDRAPRGPRSRRRGGPARGGPPPREDGAARRGARLR